MEGGLAVALEKETEGGGGESGRHIAACLIELYFLLLEHTDGELSWAVRPRPASAGIAVTSPACQRNQEQMCQAGLEREGRGQRALCNMLKTSPRAYTQLKHVRIHASAVLNTLEDPMSSSQRVKS